MKRLGVDIGSLYLSAVVSQDGRVLSRYYDEHKGEIGTALRSLLSSPDFSSWDLAG